jgi:hypothetical protein
MSNALEVTDAEARLAGKIDKTATALMKIESNRTAGLAFANMSEVMEFAKTMAIAQVGVRKHLRGNVGACLAIVVQAIEWQMSPFAVANKSYSVNDQIAYEAQLINAVILSRAPIKGRFKVEFSGEAETRKCKVWVKLRDEEETVEYESPIFSKIQPKNSPLWKTDPDQQHFYYSSRALCRRHFPDVLLGVYAVDELIDESLEIGPHVARDVTPARDLGARLDRLASMGDVIDHNPETGEVIDGADKQIHEADAGQTADAAKSETTGAAEASADQSASPRADAAGTNDLSKGAPAHSSPDGAGAPKQSRKPAADPGKGREAAADAKGDGKPQADRVAAQPSPQAAQQASAPDVGELAAGLAKASTAGVFETRRWLQEHEDAEKMLGRSKVERALRDAEDVDAAIEREGQRG